MLVRTALQSLFTRPGAAQPAAGSAEARPGARSRVVRAVVEFSPLRNDYFWRLPAGSRSVALTFDDGPDPEHTPRILEALARFDARATFFLIGEQAARYPELVAQIAAAGHTLGNHTQTHVVCSGLSDAELDAELAAADASLAPFYHGSRLPALRPPFGSIRPAQALRLARAGRRVALWSRNPQDYRGAGVATIAAMGETLAARDVVLLHDRFPATLEALPDVLEGLARRGLEAVGLDDAAAGRAHARQAATD